MPDTNANETMIALTTDIVTSFLSHNRLATDQVPSLINDVYGALNRCRTAAAPAEPDAPQPAVSIRASVKKDHITCLICGTQQAMLKRHLSAAHDLTPEKYRAMFKLPATYPLVAPNYSEHRSSLAKSMGLGRTGRGGRKNAPK